MYSLCLNISHRFDVYVRTSIISPVNYITKCFETMNTANQLNMFVNYTGSQLNPLYRERECKDLIGEGVGV